MVGHHHCVYAFHINQLNVRVSTFVYTKFMLTSFICQHTFLEYVCPRINKLSHLLNNIYHHVNVHFVKQNVCSHYWLFRWIYSFYHVYVHLCMRNICCHELSHSVNYIYHHVSVHFFKQNVCSHYWLFQWIYIFIMSTYICVCEMYVVMNCLIW